MNSADPVKVTGLDHKYDHKVEAPIEPHSALEYYEKAVHQEEQGKLGESLKHYRQAYKVRISWLLNICVFFFPPLKDKTGTRLTECSA